MNSKLYIPAMFAAILLSGCSKRTDAIAVTGNEQLTLDSWIQINVPEAMKLVVQKSEEESATMYYEWLHRDVAAEEPDALDYVYVDYTGYNFVNYNAETHRGNIFMTRQEEKARLARSYDVYTHYVPQYVEYSMENGYLYRAQEEILKMMRLGDEVRIYFPSALADRGYGITNTYGYGGNVAATSGYPMIITMKLTGIVKDVTRNERDTVDVFLEEEYGTDYLTIERETLFMHWEDKGESQISQSSLIKVYYVGYFIEEATENKGDIDEDNDNHETGTTFRQNGRRFERGFVFDTNIDSVGRRLGRDTSSYSALSFYPSASSSSYIDAFTKVFTLGGDSTITYKSQFTIITTSDWAYGSDGKTGGQKSTYIQPYQPLVFDIWVMGKDEEEDE